MQLSRQSETHIEILTSPAYSKGRIGVPAMLFLLATLLGLALILLGLGSIVLQVLEWREISGDSFLDSFSGRVYPVLITAGLVLIGVGILFLVYYIDTPSQEELALAPAELEMQSAAGIAENLFGLKKYGRSLITNSGSPFFKEIPREIGVDSITYEDARSMAACVIVPNVDSRFEGTKVVTWSLIEDVDFCIDNATDSTMNFNFDSESFTLPPRSHYLIVTTTGCHTLEARNPEGALVESREMYLKDGIALYVFNFANANTYRLIEVNYGR